MMSQRHDLPLSEFSYTLLRTGLILGKRELLIFMWCGIRKFQSVVRGFILGCLGGTSRKGIGLAGDTLFIGVLMKVSIITGGGNRCLL